MKQAKRIISLLLALVMVVSLIMSSTAVMSFAATGVYKDVSAEDWFYENVKSLKKMKLMVGYHDGTFRPENNISLAESIAVAARLHTDHYNNGKLKQGAVWYTVYTDYAVNNGLVSELPADVAAPATRAEFAHLLAKALPLDNFVALNRVPEGAIPDVESDAAIYMLYRAGVLIGADDSGNFYPDRPITRAETAAIITRMADPSLRLKSGIFGIADVELDGQGNVKSDVAIDATEAKATVAAGTAAADGAAQLSLSVSKMETSGGNVTLDGSEQLSSYDVHIDGLAADNTVPVLVELNTVLPIGLNLGNLAVYHVEDGVTNPMTQVTSLSELDAHNEFYYDPATGTLTVAMATFSEIMLVAEEAKWEGNRDYTWYDADAKELTIANADQLAAFGAIVGGMDGQTRDSFAGKTVKLISDINLGDDEENNVEGKIFYPIGYYSDDGKYEKTGVAIDSSLKTFEGTFDGNGHTVANFYHNTWEMKGDHNWYTPEEQYYRDGMGLFGRVYKGIVRNLTVKNFTSDGEIATTGVIAAYADGATFENIAIFNCNPRVYNIGNGGIVGCVGWYAKEADLKTTFKNITVDNSNKISALWGSYDVACGGIVGQYYPTSGQSSANYPVNAGIHFENCHISAQMDVYNDVCANYQYYAYRYTGMLIGSVRENVTIDGHVYPKMDGITASGCTVHFGTWNDYYYCEIIDNTTASYTHDYQMSRLDEIKAIDGTTITYLDGTTGTVPASGRANYVIVDYTKGHGTENATCYHFKDGAVWTHDMGGIQEGIDEDGDGQDDLKEDKQHIYLEFNNLVTGYGWGVTSKGVDDLDGVSILDREVGNSVVKFKAASGLQENYSRGSTVTIGELFAEIENAGVDIVDGNVQVTVSPAGEDSTAGGTYTVNGDDWKQGTLAFYGEGYAEIIITDYYFCKETKINVVITDGGFLYRVGNQNEVTKQQLAKLLTSKESTNVEIVKYLATDAKKYTISEDKIKFDDTGVVEVKVDGIQYYLEVVDAVNATSATSATAKNVVLLNDCTFNTIDVKNGYTLYGNGFTMTCIGDLAALNMEVGFVELEDGILDNVQIVCPNFSHAVLYDSNKYESDGNVVQTTDKTRYYNVYSAVRATRSSKILNSYISGGRAAVYAVDGTLLIDNSTIEGGAAANIHTGNCNLTLKDITLIQEPKQATVHDTTKKLMGLSVVVMCDGGGLCAPITLEGTLTQYAWAHEDYSKYVPADGKSFVTKALEKTDYIHEITYEDGTTNDSLNLGFLFMPTGTTAPEKPEDKMLFDNRTDKTNMPYSSVNINGLAYVYSYKNSNGTADDVKTKPASYTPNRQAPSAPAVSFTDANENRIFTTAFDNTTGLWTSTLKVDVDAGVYNFSFDKLLVQKYGQNLAYTVKDAKGNDVNKDTIITLSAADEIQYVLEIVDNQHYDQNGNKVENESVKVTYAFNLLSTKTSLPAPTWTSKNLTGTPYIVVDTNDSDWNCAVPVLDGLKVKYWSKKQSKEIELDLANVVSAAGLDKGLQNGSNNTITITVADEYTLTVTTTGFKTNDNGKPVVVNNKLYFTVSSSSNYVSIKTTDRAPNISYIFTDANNSDPITLNKSFSVVYADHKSTQYKYSDFCNGTLTEASCVTPDTLITLADGTQVRVDSLKGDEELLVWNLETGALDTAPILFVDSDPEQEFEIVHLYFSDGTDVKVIYEHGFWDYDLNKYVYLDANAEQYIGHTFAKQNGDELIKVTLTDVVIETEVTTAWSPVTAGHLCYFVNGMLSMPGGVGGLFNIFDVDAETMTYDYEAMAKDIEKYGLFTYEELNAIEPLSKEMFDLAGGAYLKISIAKGNLTMDELVAMIRRYSKYV